MIKVSSTTGYESVGLGLNPGLDSLCTTHRGVRPPLELVKKSLPRKGELW